MHQVAHPEAGYKRPPIKNQIEHTLTVRILILRSAVELVARRVGA